jgi:hypothetical protein
MKLTSDIKTELDAANQSGIFKPYHWRLCAAAHEQIIKQNMLDPQSVRHTATDVVVWIELADLRADDLFNPYAIYVNCMCELDKELSPLPFVIDKSEGASVLVRIACISYTSVTRYFGINN